MEKNAAHAFGVNMYCMDAWALFRTSKRRASIEKAFAHQYEKEAGSRERSPPRH
jgi:hypothetical protein